MNGTVLIPVTKLFGPTECEANMADTNAFLTSELLANPLNS
jgi:hypothetical protein